MFRAHSANDYHVKAVLDAENFLDVFENKKVPIIQQIDNDRYLQIDIFSWHFRLILNLKIYRLIQVKENGNRLIPIIQCIKLCGRENIPLRGHRDFGSFNIDG